MANSSNEDNQRYNRTKALYNEKLAFKKAEENGAINSNSKDSSIKSKEEVASPASIINNVKGISQLSKPGGSASFISGKMKIKKGKWPIWAAILITLGGGVGFLTLLSPGLVIIHIKESLTSALDSSSPALSIRTTKVLKNKFKTKYSFASSTDGKCNILCKFNSIDEKMLNKLKTQGFEVETEQGSTLNVGKDRYILKSLAFPEVDGSQKIVKTGAEFDIAMKDSANAVSFKKAFNSKTAYFNNSKFGVMLNEKFNLNKTFDSTSKAKDEATGKSTTAKERALAAIREKLGLPEIEIDAETSIKEKVEANPKYKAVTDFANSTSMKAVDKTSNALSAVCAAYNVSKGITYASKISKITAAAGFAMMIAGAADKSKSGDEIDTEILDVIGAMATEADENGDTATSSAGYRAAVYNEPVNLTEEDKKYSATNSGEIVSLIGEFSAAIGLGGVIATQSLRTACKSSGNIAVDVATTCPTEVLAAFVTSAETFGLGAVFSAATCITKMALLDAAVSKTIGTVMNNIIPKIVATDLPVIDENTKGAAAGDLLTTGFAQTLGAKAATYGLTAGNASQIEQYEKDVAYIKQEEETLARYEAKDTPLDIYNQYSFLGSIAKTINIGAFYNTSLITKISSLLSFIPKSLASLAYNVNAEAATKAELYNKCEDSGLASIGVSGDAFCNPYYFMNSSEMNTDVEATAQHMIEKGYIEESTGEAISGTDYEKYLDNCANRIDPLGETSAAIEDDDYFWKTGYNCTLQPDSNLGEELAYFHTYTMDKAVQDTLDNNETTTNTTADSTIDIAHLYDDSTDVDCAPGTTFTEVAIGYTDNNPVNINLCSIPNTTDDDLGTTKVNSRVSGAYLKLINGLRKTTGKDIINTASSFRTMAMQEALQFQGNAAPPGYSNHQMGLAIDYWTATNEYLKPFGFWTPFYPGNDAEIQHIEPIK